MKRYRLLIFMLLSSGYVLVYFHRLCTSVLAVELMNDFNAGGPLIGLLGAAYFYSYALMQLPAGMLSDSWGARKTITVFFIVAFIGSMILGMAPTVAWAIAGRVIVGIGVAMLFVPTLKILSEWFEYREFAYMTGILLAMGGVGSFIAATPLALLSTWIGWRYAFVLIGMATLFMALMIWIFVRNRPSDKGWQAVMQPGKEQLSPVGTFHAVKQVLTCAYFWPVAIWFFFDFAVFFSLGAFWGGPYLIHVYGMSKDEAGRILSMMAAGLVVGGPLLSWLSDRLFRGRKPVLVLTSSGMVIMTGLLVVFTTSIPVWGLYLFFFMLTVCGNATGVIGFTMNKELFPVAIAGTASGLVNLFPFIGGAVFQPFLGYILEKSAADGGVYTPDAYQSAFIALFICAWIALAAALCSRETLKKGSSGL